MKSNNQINIPEARAAMDKFKMEAASEVGVNLKEGYNGDLSSREAGSVGGQMVKKMRLIHTGSPAKSQKTPLKFPIFLGLFPLISLRLLRTIEPYQLSSSLPNFTDQKG